MPRLFVIFLLFVLTFTNAVAKGLLIYKVSQKNTNKFLIKKISRIKRNSKIKIYNSHNKVGALAKIEKCNKKVCLAKVYKKRKGFKIKKKQRVSLILGKKRKSRKTRSYGKHAKQIKRHAKDSSVLVGIGGGPVSFGYSIGYQNCSILDSYCIESNAGMVDTTLGKVLVSGQYISLGLHKDIYDLGSFRLYLLGQVGFFNSKLNFSNIDSNNYITKINTIFGSTTLGVAYNFSKNISIYSGLGYSINTFKDNYGNSANTYKIGFASGLLILDFGIKYKF